MVDSLSVTVVHFVVVVHLFHIYYDVKHKLSMNFNLQFILKLYNRETKYFFRL